MRNRPFGNQYGAVWTDEQDAALRKHLLAGLSSSLAATEINKEFGTAFTRNSVIGRTNRQKMPRGQLQRTTPSSTAKLAWVREGISRSTYFRRLQGNIQTMKPAPIKCDEPRMVDVVPLKLSLIDLKDHQCRWPYGDKDYSFCGHPVYGDSSYCADHLGLSFRSAA